MKCLGRGHVANQCPNWRVIKIKESRDIDSKEEYDHESMSPSKDASDGKWGVESCLIITRRAPNTQPEQERWGTSRKHFSILGTMSITKCVPWSLIKEVAQMWLGLASLKNWVWVL